MSTKEEKKVPILGLPMAPNTHLLDTMLFRVLVGGPICIGLLLLIIALCFSWESLSLCGETECFNKFFDLFKFQIAIMGMAIPFGALVASQHRSVQTKEQIASQWKQINAQEQQNIFSNHLSHRNHFNQFFEEFEPFGKITMYSKWEVYDSLFPFASEGNFQASKDAVGLVTHIQDLTDRIGREVISGTYDFGPEPKICAFAFDKRAAALLGFSREKTAKEAIDMKANELQNYLSNIHSLVLGLHSCLNFHKTHLANSQIQKITKKLTWLINELEIECRTERLGNSIMKSLINDPFGLDEKKLYQNQVEETFKSELDLLKKNHFPGERLDYDALEQETRAALTEYVPAEKRNQAIQLLPPLLRMLIR